EQRPQHHRPIGGGDPIWRLWEALPPEWRGPVLGGMAHWQACDGTRVSVLAMAQLAHIVRHAVCEGHSEYPTGSGTQRTLLEIAHFFEYFHGDNGAALGASHQTGW